MIWILEIGRGLAYFNALESFLFSPIFLLFIFMSTAPTFQCVIIAVSFLFVVVVQASTCMEGYLGEISVTSTLYSFDGSSL